MPEVKRTRLPSGVQPSTVSAAGCQVRRLGTPPPAGMTNTSTFPSYSPVKAIWEPSGEKTGLVSKPGLEVRRLASPPARGTVHRSPANTNTMSVWDKAGFWREPGRAGIRPSRPAAAPSRTKNDYGQSDVQDEI